MGHEKMTSSFVLYDVAKFSILVFCPCTDPWMDALHVANIYCLSDVHYKAWERCFGSSDRA